MAADPAPSISTPRRADHDRRSTGRLAARSVVSIAGSLSTGSLRMGLGSQPIARPPAASTGRSARHMHGPPIGGKHDGSSGRSPGRPAGPPWRRRRSTRTQDTGWAENASESVYGLPANLVGNAYVRLLPRTSGCTFGLTMQACPNERFAKIGSGACPAPRS